MVATLSRLFAKAIDEGELDYLEGRSVKVEAADAGVSFAFGMDDGKLIRRAIDANHDLTLTGKVYDFLLLASR
ncbi:MAG: sterol-binding protein, partial [Gammaproteobacteria bacterium]